MLDILIFMLELTAILILGMVIAILLIMILTTVIVMIQEAIEKVIDGEYERKDK